MKNTLYAVAAASVGMLVTSGIVAFAIAAPEVSDQEADAYVSELIDIHWLDSERR